MAILFTLPSFAPAALKGDPALRGQPAVAGNDRGRQRVANENKVTRKGSPPIKVYCLPDERAAIEANAQASGMSTSAYLLAVGQGYRVQGVTDFENVRELVRVNGDLGRLGGLLKLWLTDDSRTARFGEDTIRALLARIEATQDKISTIAESVVRPRGGRS